MYTPLDEVQDVTETCMNAMDSENIEGTWPGSFVCAHRLDLSFFICVFVLFSGILCDIHAASLRRQVS